MISIKKLVLDTNIYSYFAEGVADIVEYLSDFQGKVYIPAVVMGELYYGFKKGSRQRLNEKKLKEFIGLFDAEVINVDDNVASFYSSIILNLEKKGRKIPTNDAWVAACSMSIGGILFSKDEKHFGDIENLNRVLL